MRYEGGRIRYEVAGRCADEGGVNPFLTFGGVTRAEPVGNAERQRKFRQRHPGYHRRYYLPVDRYRTPSVLLGAVASPPTLASASPDARAAAAFDPVI